MPKLGGRLVLARAQTHTGLKQPQARLVAGKASSLVLAAAAAGGKAETGSSPIIAMPRRHAAICIRALRIGLSCARVVTQPLLLVQDGWAPHHAGRMPYSTSSSCRMASRRRHSCQKWRAEALACPQKGHAQSFMSPPALKCRRVGVRTAPPRQIRKDVRSSLDKECIQACHAALEDASISAESSPSQSFRLTRTEARACTRAQTRKACAPAGEAGSKDPAGGTGVLLATATMAVLAEAFSAAEMALESAPATGRTHRSPRADQDASRRRDAA